MSRLLLALVPALAFTLCRCGDEEAHAEQEHDHVHTPHDGVLAALTDSSGKQVGHVELKLHDDKGDLECWMGKDKNLAQPFQLPLDQTVEVHFPQLDQTVTLVVRNQDGNEDEEGNATVVDGKTNYFIFPTTEDEDASWLMGADFSAPCTVKFEFEGEAYSTAEFTLMPHTHHEH